MKNCIIRVGYQYGISGEELPLCAQFVGLEGQTLDNATIKHELRRGQKMLVKRRAFKTPEQAMLYLKAITAYR